MSFKTVHGVLINIRGLGVLITGKSGIGKSECALDLIYRGSKLVSDDVIVISKDAPSLLIGRAPVGIRHIMNIRGVGLINIEDMFGKSSVLERCSIDMVINLVQPEDDDAPDLTGLDERKYTLLDVDLPYWELSVNPGRNIALVIEIAVRNQLLKHSGVVSLQPKHMSGD